MSSPLLILGASARAAAFSALRGGFSPHAADLFADLDLARCCPARRVQRYPHGFLNLITDLPHAPWLYTGGLENHPDLVDRLAAMRPLWGNVGETLRSVRDPWQLAEALSVTSCQMPEIRRSSAGLPRDGSWLRKGRQSSGGLQVESWDDNCRGDHGKRRHYFQQRVAGMPCSAVYVAAQGRALLLGATEQLIGDDDLTQWTHARRWHYCGSLGPLATTSQQRRKLVDLGDALAGRFGLVGLFGVDVIANENGIWPLEVNPRFPASVEILERAGNFSAVALHAAACRHGELPGSVEFESAAWHGKAILFARQALVMPDSCTAEVEAALQSREHPTIADVPHPQTPIRPHLPILTLFASAADRTTVLAMLRQQAGGWEPRLYDR